jgi:hypothetical protein
LRLTDKIIIKRSVSAEEDDKTKYSSNSSQAESNTQIERKQRKKVITRSGRTLLNIFYEWMKNNEA